MSTTIHNASINNDRNVEDLDVNPMYTHNTTNHSSTTQDSDSSEAVASCSSTAYNQPSTEEVDSYNVAQSSKNREQQVRNIL